MPLVLQVLIRNCKNTLRIVDVEMSKQVTDQAVQLLTQCQNIHTLHIFHTSITVEGHSALLFKLKQLKVLVRGGFLCEALEYMSDNCKTAMLPQLGLEEFWASEDYYFHSDYQMELVARMCPKMRKMMFQFSTEVMTNLLTLAQFSALTELHLWGGEFYTDRSEIISTGVHLA